MAWQGVLQSVSFRVRPGSFSGYLIALGLVSLATALRWALGGHVEGAQFVTLFPAVILATLVAGEAAGVAAIAVAVPFAWFFVLLPRYSFEIRDDGQIYALVIFALVASLDVIIVGLLRQSIDRTRRLNQTLAAVFEANPDAVLVTDRLSTIATVNQRAVELFGIPREALVGTPLGNLVPERYRDRHADYHAAFMRGPRSRAMGVGLDLYARRGDGTEFPVDIQIGPIELGGDTRAIATIRDLTEQKALTAALEDSRRARMALEERQRVADELRIGEDRLRDFAALASDWMWEQDADLRLTWVSAASRGLASDPSQRIGKLRWEYQDTSLDPEGWERHRQDLLAHRPFHDFRYQTETPDGEIRFSSITGKPLFADDGTFLGYRGVGRDVTEQIRADLAVVTARDDATKAEALLRDAIDSISEGLMIWDASDRLIAANIVDRGEDPYAPNAFALGRRFDDIARRLLDAGVFPDAVGREDDWLADRMRQHRAVAGSRETLIRDGRWVRVTERRMRNGGTVTLHVDITDQKETEIALRETEERFERAQAVGGIGTWEHNLVRDVWFLSKEVYRARGLDPATFVPGRGAERRHVHPDDRVLVRDWLVALRTGIRQRPVEERIVLSDGQQRIHRIEGQPILDSDGAVTRIVGTVQDVTDQRIMERQLAQAQKMEAIGAVTGGMAHDFNNLLGVIILSLGFASSRMSDTDRLKALVKEALTAAERGAELIRSLLAFARRQALRPVRIDINEQVTGMHRLISRVLGEDIVISLHLVPGIWPVTADPAQLEACIMNLATNARDAMTRGGTLTLTTANCHLDAQYAAAHPTVTPGDYTSISVTDTGVGMTPDVLAKIFDPFFSTKAPGHGTGLGLSMVFGFATQSGGHVTAYSEPGVGTTIRLYLPRAIASDVQAAVVPRNTEPTPVGGGETILVVEDNDALRGVVTQQLEELGYRVLEASSAAAALALLAAAPADLVFSDLVMAGDMDGFDLAARVRADWPDVPIVLTTGFAGAREGERLTGPLASVRVLNKPYDLGALARTMRDALQKAAG